MKLGATTNTSMRRRGTGLVRALAWWALVACAPLPSPAPSVQDGWEAQRLIDQGTLHLRRGELAKAQASFEVALGVRATSAALDGLGCVEFLRGNLSAAAELYRRAYNLDNTYASALVNLALVLEVGGERGSAAQVYERALALDPLNVRARNNFAALLYDTRVGLDGLAVAQSELLRAQTLAPHPLIRENLQRMNQAGRTGSQGE